MKIKKTIKVLLYVVFGISTFMLIATRRSLVLANFKLAGIAIFSIIGIKYVVETITGKESNENPYADIESENEKVQLKEKSNSKSKEKNNDNNINKVDPLYKIFNGLLAGGIWLFILLVCTIVLTCNTYSDYEIVKPDRVLYLDRISIKSGVGAKAMTNIYNKYYVKYEYDGEEYSDNILINTDYLEGIFVDNVDLDEWLYLFVNDSEALPFWQTFVKRILFYHLLLLVSSMSICWFINTELRINKSKVILEENYMLIQRKYLIIGRIVLLFTIIIALYLFYLTADFYNIVI